MDYDRSIGSFFCLFTGIALAAVTPINQPPFSPVKINKPGSYQLQLNLVVPDANTTAILVQADNVTIDLNGFAILGPTVCTGSGSTLVCSPTGTGNGIDAGTHNNIKVYNGTVRGMGNEGITIGNGAIIESVRLTSNGSIGIHIISNATVNGNTATGNGGFGLELVGLTIGYVNNVLYNNASGNVSGGVNLGHNLCGIALCP